MISNEQRIERAGKIMEVYNVKVEEYFHNGFIQLFFVIVHLFAPLEFILVFWF